jgi:hypothetical protein
MVWSSPKPCIFQPWGGGVTRSGPCFHLREHTNTHSLNQPPQEETETEMHRLQPSRAGSRFLWFLISRKIASSLPGGGISHPFPP